MPPAAGAPLAHAEDMDTTTTPSPTTIDEVTALFTAVLERPSDAPTACVGWTAHELLAHLAAGAHEEAELIDTHLAGNPSRATRPLDERELPYRELPDDELRGRLVELGERLTGSIDRLRASGEDEGVAFTGRTMRAADFAMHSRSECALHRWDLVGSDEVSRELLSQPKLTAHALTVLTSMAVLPEAPANRLGAASAAPDTSVVLRSADDDLVVTLDADAVSLAIVARGPVPASVELEAADRLLLLWGRRPSVPPSVSPGATGAQRDLLRALFAL
jgi:hypothetical protein